MRGARKRGPRPSPARQGSPGASASTPLLRLDHPCDEVGQGAWQAGVGTERLSLDRRAEGRRRGRGDRQTAPATAVVVAAPTATNAAAGAARTTAAGRSAPTRARL